jgi:hypothetical protein
MSSEEIGCNQRFSRGENVSGNKTAGTKRKKQEEQ